MAQPEPRARAVCFRSRRLVEGDLDMGKASLQP